MQIYVDGDACPVIKQVEMVASEYNIKVIILCDTNHILSSDYSEVKMIGAGRDAVDFEIATLCNSGDIVVTQDYGLAALVLGKGCYAIHQSGRWYTNDNIEQLLFERHIAGKERRKSGKYRVKHSPANKNEEGFIESFRKLVLTASEVK